MVQSLKNILSSCGFKLPVIVLAALLLVLQIYHIWHYPIWCDDAFFGIVAKNLADSFNYAAVVYDKTYPFYFGISSGPVMIIPAALMIFIFGNYPWILGLTMVSMLWFLLITIFIAAKRLLLGDKIWLSAFLFLALALLFSINNQNYGIYTKDHLAIWHLLLGEIPSALLIILGTVFLAADRLHKKNVIIGAAILGLAILCKTIAAIAALMVLLMVVLRIFFTTEFKKFGKFQLIFLLGFCFAAPFSTFEIIKIISLGWQHYHELQLENSGFYQSIAFVGYEKAFPWGKVDDVVNLFGGYFFLLIFLALYLVRTSYKERSASYLAGVTLITCFFLHLIWWVYCSVFVNDRYLISALFYCFAGIALLTANLNFKNKIRFTLVWLAILLLFFGRFESISYLVKDGFKKNNKLLEQVQVASAVTELKNQGTTIISCGLNSELEYLLPNSANFKNCFEWLKENSGQSAALINYFVVPQQVLFYNPFEHFTKIQDLPDAIKSRCKEEYLVTENFSILWCK